MFSLNHCDYPLLILQLGSNDPVSFDHWCAQSIASTPDLIRRPWAIDLASFPGHVDIGEMVRVCRKHRVNLAGVMGLGAEP